MSTRPIAPRDWKTTNAVTGAKKPSLVLKVTAHGKQIPAFNGSQTSRRNKKRPITLPERA